MFRQKVVFIRENVSTATQKDGCQNDPAKGFHQHSSANLKAHAKEVTVSPLLPKQITKKKGFLAPFAAN
jgi:hypothetical protein